ncbi:serine/threonine-protein phosphatase [Chromobacterium subtsugae]|uniref:Serine/threonine-protein phosphatase n=1 Tax=Chromobacterium subtsugae TaxID=251747 RepID=A0ABS7FI25_9NEIS|nr:MULTISPECIES: protein phosphatase 2C domain-containing protein [Chromobacterium]KUM03715.1 phosphatase [Chromobacterium subtsugae]KZE85691.1 phosphatase [Chromobacterium sp. F49]MBW7567908.1 serine/threonine-protein phosphatase [Chromobacterium subtsugae]MBW8289135.1 serine/threonine-protein phosphatase [Chromobacterium subtsugae]WSE92618.1 protein phosphatase 2C domain-containing protein [Chromobacterium subtsugae]
MKLSIFQESRIGGRSYNQDRLALAHSRDTVMLVVADGMGGHMRGEVAAQITVDLLSELFYQQAAPTLSYPNRFLVNAISSVHQVILEYAADHRLPDVPSTTVVVAIIQQGQLYWCHVGDSRLYLLDGQGMRLRSRDHSQVQRLIDQGLLSEEGAKTHPDRNKIYNCLGATSDPDIDIGERQEVGPGCSIVLCTDGLWSQVQDGEMEKVFAGRHVNQVLPALINVAERRAGAGGDNLSALAVTLLDDSVELGDRDDVLDTEKTPPQKGGRLILESNLETMHQEILASQVGKGS